MTHRQSTQRSSGQPPVLVAGCRSRRVPRLQTLRITKGFERKAARGERLGGPSPYGYTLDSATKTLMVPDIQRPGPSLARACGTPVRMGPRQVGLRCGGAAHRPARPPPYDVG